MSLGTIHQNIKTPLCCINYLNTANLNNYPHAFVLGCIMDRQIEAERAWIIPYRFKQKLGDFSFETLTSLSQDRIMELMTKPDHLHWLSEKMSRNFHFAIRLIEEKYSGDASLIWSKNPSSAEVVYRFLEFRGVGPKIATMATNILAREFKIDFSDYYSIDISADALVKRVFKRLGLVKKKDVNTVIFKARALNPEFPGLLDYPTWKIGREWCSPRKPDCNNCTVSNLCQYAEKNA
jgi:endonuclease III